jgi:hypothetical protein
MLQMGAGVKIAIFNVMCVETDYMYCTNQSKLVFEVQMQFVAFFKKS